MFVPELQFLAGKNTFFKMLKAVVILAMICIFTAAENCDEQMFGSFGAIISPGYQSEPYPSNLTCSYKITTTQATAVTLEVVNIILSSSSEIIKIYDGPTNSSQLIGSYPGLNVGDYIYSSTNEVLVYFNSYYGSSSNGFYIYYKERETDNRCPEITKNGDSGIIESPQYPVSYPNDIDCYYSITTSPNTQIMFTFDFIDVEETYNCANDFVEFYDGQSTESNNIAKVCGSGPVNNIFSYSNKVFVHFHSDNTTKGLGFSIAYDTNPCPDTIQYNGVFGTISSPGYPVYYYPNFSTCNYTVITPLGSTVHIQVIDLRMDDYSSSCYYDYLRIYDGLDENSTVLDTFCGEKAAISVRASTNEVLLEFHANEYNNEAGFMVVYTASYDDN